MLRHRYYYVPPFDHPYFMSSLYDSSSGVPPPPHHHLAQLDHERLRLHGPGAGASRDLQQQHQQLQQPYLSMSGKISNPFLSHAEPALSRRMHDTGPTGSIKHGHADAAPYFSDPEVLPSKTGSFKSLDMSAAKASGGGGAAGTSRPSKHQWQHGKKKDEKDRRSSKGPSDTIIVSSGRKGARGQRVSQRPNGSVGSSSASKKPASKSTSRLDDHMDMRSLHDDDEVDAGALSNPGTKLTEGPQRQLRRRALADELRVATRSVQVRLPPSKPPPHHRPA